MINITLNGVKNLFAPVNRLTETEKCENNKKNKINSLAYLAYKNRKQKGLISSEKEECPVIYFGDEWAF